MNATQTSRDTSWYPHHRSPRQFIPLQQIKVAASPGEWHSLGADPLFALEGQLPLPGWNMLELDEESSVSGVVATLTLESSRRQVTFDFPVRQGK